MSSVEPPAGAQSAGSGTSAPLPNPRRRRWRRRLLTAAALVTSLLVLHRPLFRGLGNFLAADDPLAKADYLVVPPSVAGDSAAIDDALSRIQAGRAAGLIFFNPPATRSVKVGAWPDFETAARRALRRRGLADSAIVFIAGENRTSWDAARSLERWLAGHGNARLDMLCQPLRGRYERSVFASVLTERAMQQLHFCAAAGPIDESNWWQSREGIQVLFQNYARLGFLIFNGESVTATDQWNYEQFEESLPPAK